MAGEAGNGLEQAANAFSAVISADPNKGTRSSAKSDQPSAPDGAVFPNLGQLEVDDESPAKGGGDGMKDPPVRTKEPTDDEILYGEEEEPKAGTGDTGKEDGDDSEGDDAEQGGDDDAGDDDGDASGAEGDGEEEAALLAKKVEVTVDGEPQEVTIREALDGYIRTQTFHARLNQLEDAKKIVRRAAADAVQNFEVSKNLVAEMEEHMAKLIPPEPDWDAEFAKDAAKARDLQKYYQQAATFREGLRKRMAEAKKVQDEAAAKQTAAFVEEESQKFDNANRKQWTDPKRKAKDLQSMRKTALAQGFTEEEISQVYDSRMLTILLKASKYDRMMAARPKPVVRPQGRQPVAPGGGSAKQRTARKGVNTAMRNLNRTGSVGDAAVVFDQIIAGR